MIKATTTPRTGNVRGRLVPNLEIINFIFMIAIHQFSMSKKRECRCLILEPKIIEKTVLVVVAGSREYRDKSREMNSKK